MRRNDPKAQANKGVGMLGRSFAPATAGPGPGRQLARHRAGDHTSAGSAGAPVTASNSTLAALRVHGFPTRQASETDDLAHRLRPLMVGEAGGRRGGPLARLGRVAGGVALGAGALALVGCTSRPLRPSESALAATPKASEPAWVEVRDAQGYTALAASPSWLVAVGDDGPVRFNRADGEAQPLSWPDEAWAGGDLHVALAEDGAVWLAGGGRLARWHSAQGWQVIALPALDRTQPAPIGAVAAAGPGAAWLRWGAVLLRVQGGAATAVAHLAGVGVGATCPAVAGAAPGTTAAACAEAQALAVDASGTLWTPLPGVGLAAVTAEAVVMHGPAQGVCGAEVQAVAAGEGPWIVAQCAEGRVSIGRRTAGGGATWQSLRVAGGGLAAVGTSAGGALLQVAGLWYTAQPGTASGDTTAGPLGAPTLAAADPPTASVTPAVPPPSLPEGISVGWRPRRRAEGAPLPEAPWRLAPVALQPVAGGRVQVDAEGTLWRLGDEGGISAVAGPARQAYASEALRRSAAPGRLVVDGAGALYWPLTDVEVLRSQPDGTWAHLALPEDAGLTGMAADAAGTVWAVAALAPAEPGGAPRLRVLRAAPAGAFEVVREATVPGFRRVRTGTPAVGAAGDLYLPLFDVGLDGQPVAAGLGHLAPGASAVQVWPGGLGAGLKPEGEGAVGLPDPVVNAVAVGAEGVVWVATNAGLVRVRDGVATVYDENAWLDSELMIDVAVDATGRAWAVSLAGPGRVEDDRWIPLNVKGLEAGVRGVRVDADGGVWLVTDHGLWRSAGAAGWRREPLGPVAPPLDIVDVAVGPGGKAWARTATGLWRRTAR